MITVGLQPAEHPAARDALASLRELDHITDVSEGLAVYVQSGAAAVADVVRLLVEVGIRPGTIALSRPTLDDVLLAYAGTAIAIALKTKNVQSTNASFIIFFPLLFLTPNFVPLELLAGPLRTPAQLNPVTYVIIGLRDLVLYPDIHWGSLGACVLTIVLTGLALSALSLRRSTGSPSEGSSCVSAPPRRGARRASV